MKTKDGKTEHDPQLIANILLIQQIWKQNTIPSEWNTGIIVPIYKKGDKEKCVNYRPITLNITYRILADIINKKTEIICRKVH